MSEKARKPDNHKISLRPIQLSDIQDFMMWASDDRVTPWYRAICVERAVGSISVTPSSGDRSHTAELAYFLALEHWGKGIATEAVKMVASTIFMEWPLLERLEAFVDVDNVRSQRVLARTGFTREGVLRKNQVVKGRCIDNVVFSLLSSDRRIMGFRQERMILVCMLILAIKL